MTTNTQKQTKAERRAARAEAALKAGPRRIPDDVIAQMLMGAQTEEGIQGVIRQFTKQLLERAMQAELTAHLGYEKSDPSGYNSGNSRNGKTGKTVTGDFGEIEVETPRDRNGTFEPRIIGKHQTRFAGFDRKILALYAAGMSARDIQQHLQEMYQVEVSPSLISEVTEGVMEQFRAWQNRPLEEFYGIVFLDALYVKIRHEGRVENRAIYVALGVNLEGRKEVLGLWSTASEGAKFWMHVLTELKSRGMKDAYVMCVDGLTGFPQAIGSVFPMTLVQLCIVHMTRASLNYVTWQDRKKVAADLKNVYRAATADEAERQLTEFEAKWDRHYPAIGRQWRGKWEQLVPFFGFPPEVRKVVYTTNAVEALNRSLRKVIKTKGSFPNEDAAYKLLYLAQMNAAKKWQTVQGWKQMLNYLDNVCGDRIRQAGARL